MAVIRKQQQCAHCKNWFTVNLMKDKPGPPVCRECMN